MNSDSTHLPAPQVESSVWMGWIRSFFGSIFEITFRPHRFFSRLPPLGGVAGPLAFALAVSWLGKLGQFFWQSALTGELMRKTDPAWRLMGDVADVDHPGNSQAMMDLRERAMHWFMGAGSVLLDPFLTLVSILFVSFFVFLGSRILVTPGRNGAPGEIRYETALRLVSYGKAPLFLAALPIAGPVLGTLLSAIATVIGAREIYRVSYGRAIGVALFPQLLLFGFLLFGMFMLFLAALKLFSAFLGV